MHRGSRIAPIDRNYWGVTFAADDDHFYATVAFGGRDPPGSRADLDPAVDTMRTDAECPSLSPDGTRVAYKKRGDRGPGRLAARHARPRDRQGDASSPRAAASTTRSSGSTTQRIVYGMPGQGSNAAQTDVWVVAADGTGSPAVLIEKAWSPAVVR